MASSSCSARYCSTHAFDGSTLARSDTAVLPVSTRKATSSSSYQLFSFVGCEDTSAQALASFVKQWHHSYCLTKVLHVGADVP
eukprot:15377-Heterococcus_DN1.PRE.4